jgi:ATP-dependent protease ClpP protease subunit
MADNELILYGTVGASFWEEEYFTSKTVRDWLAGRTGDITVRINSGGGVASEGHAIYTMLKDYKSKGRVTVIVDAVAASAASLISMVGDEIIYRLGAWTMIHDPSTPWTMGRGTEEDHLKEAAILATISNAYADIYAATSGKSREECREIMKAETVLDGAMAVEMGFATSVETASEAVPEADFDYRIYAHAPERLRRAAEKLGRAPAEEAVMAMIAGRAGQPLERTIMNARVLPPNPAAAGGDPPVKITMTARQVSDFHRRAAVAGIATDKVTEIIESGKSFDQAMVALNELWVAEGDLDEPMRGRATIGRDEGTTLREGMEGALVARLTGAREVTGPARQFMGLTFPEMAATFMGSREPVRTAGDRLRAIEMSHSRSDFPAIFENAMNKSLLSVYRAAPVSYRSIAQRRDFRDFRPHPVVGVGDFPMLEQVGEGGEIKYGTTSESKETLALIPYAKAFRISRQMQVDDDLDGIGRVIADRARAVAAFEDKTFYAMALSGANADGPTLLQTARQVFNTTDGTKAAAPAALTVASIGLAWSSLRKRKSLDGNDLELTPTVLLVGPDKELEAMQLVADIAANESGKVNPYAGKLTLAVSAKITGNAWYLFASPEAAPCFAYGYLEGEAGPRMRMDEPFGQQGMAWSVELDFGCGAIDFRGGYKNAGA